MANARRPLYKSKEQYRELLTDHLTRLGSQQQILYASSHPSGVPCHGRSRQRRLDQARHVRRQSARPSGVQLQAPEPHGTAHDFLWRTTRDLPERGRIGIFNRSYYEEVLIVRAHRDILLSERLRRAGRRQSPLARPFIGRSRIWKGISMPTAPASSNSSFISRRRSSGSVSSPASTSPKRTGNSAPPRSKNANSGSAIWRPTRNA
jgi:Polyphosphate kinase 2 (PPK2)